MSIQVKIGSRTEWTACPSGVPHPGYVLFDGEQWRTAPDGFTSQMVWDVGLQNVRAMTESEIAAFTSAEAQRLEDAVPERKALRQQSAQAIADINTYLSIATPTTAQNSAALKKLAMITKAVILRLVQVD